MHNIVEKDWVIEKLNSPRMVIIDCRFSLGDPQYGYSLYQKSHLPGAVYCHLENHLSSPVMEHGGRHPLPNLELFIQYLETAGINKDSIVVAYDNGESAYAARLWWLLKYLGHKEVYILNGGFYGWETARYPVDSNTPVRTLTNYEYELQPHILASYEEVKSLVESKSQGTILIDSREPKRYLGKEEPIDKVPGRIPGSINKFWSEGLEAGHFKSIDEQKKRFIDLNPHQPIIVYCGSGVTAVPNFLLLNELGFKDVKLYIGSYSDWVSYESNKVDVN
jgi:thiosulfate/3-mercaptopyruvate sulfurtransferase